MLFYKVLILFWGCTRTCSHDWWFENHIIFHIIYIITILSPQPHTNDSISSVFDEGPPSEKQNVFLSQCVVIGEQLRRCFRQQIHSLPAGGAV